LRITDSTLNTTIAQTRLQGFTAATSSLLIFTMEANIIADFPVGQTVVMAVVNAATAVNLTISAGAGVSYFSIEYLTA
jgi:hypothetical protein